MSQIDKKQVENYFNKAVAAHQDENAVLDSALGQEHSNIYRNYFSVHFIIKNLNPRYNQTILDFGCGVGRISKLLSLKSKKIVGVDSNSKMIETAKKNETVKNIDYYLLSELVIPFKENQFDTCFSSWVFQHISDDETFIWLNELKRILKENGKILLFEQVKMQTTSTSGKHLFRSTEHYKNLFNRAGLKLISSFPVMRVPSRGMWLWNKLPAIKLLLPFLALIDKFTLNRKSELAEYFTYCFVLSKQ